jgi:hypothetical protein
MVVVVYEGYSGALDEAGGYATYPAGDEAA